MRDKSRTYIYTTQYTESRAYNARAERTLYIDESARACAEFSLRRVRASERELLLMREAFPTAGSAGSLPVTDMWILSAKRIPHRSKPEPECAYNTREWKTDGAWGWLSGGGGRFFSYFALSLKCAARLALLTLELRGGSSRARATRTRNWVCACDGERERERE